MILWLSTSVWIYFGHLDNNNIWKTRLNLCGVYFLSLTLHISGKFLHISRFSRAHESFCLRWPLFCLCQEQQTRGRLKDSSNTVWASGWTDKSAKFYNHPQQSATALVLSFFKPSENYTLAREIYLMTKKKHEKEKCIENKTRWSKSFCIVVIFH